MADQPAHPPRRIAVIGGGIAGLAAAHRLRELDAAAHVTLFEASDRLGGVIDTIHQDGYLIEAGADSFITNLPWAVDLCRRVGLADQLISTDSAHRRALVVSRGRLHPVPEGFLLMAPERLWPLVRSPILSVGGKLRAAWEFLIRPRAGDADESLASFARRRLGREAFDRLVQPLVGGIYTADPEKLSLAATLPRFREMERRHGGLIRAMRAARKSKSDASGDDSGARYSLFAAPRDGMKSLVQAVSARLPADTIQLCSQVERIDRLGQQWKIQVRGTSATIEHTFDALIAAAPAPVAAKLLDAVDAPLAAELGGIEYAPSAVVVLGYARAQIARPLDGFGFVVPQIERRQILSASFSSVKFAGRAPQGRVLIRVFLGGALQPELVDIPDEQLCRIAETELADLLRIAGGPSLSRVFRWRGAMPQYHLGHLDRLARIRDRLDQFPTLTLAGNAFEGVGIPQCIHSGEQAAEQVVR